MRALGAALCLAVALLGCDGEEQELRAEPPAEDGGCAMVIGTTELFPGGESMAFAFCPPGSSAVRTSCGGEEPELDAQGVLCVEVGGEGGGTLVALAICCY